MNGQILDPASTPKPKPYAPPHTTPNIDLREEAPKARGLPSRKTLIAGAMIVGLSVAFALITGLSHKERVHAGQDDTSIQTAIPPASLRDAQHDYAPIDLRQDIAFEETPPKPAADYPDLSDSGIDRGLPPASLEGGPPRPVRSRPVSAPGNTLDSDADAASSAPILFGGSTLERVAGRAAQESMTLPSTLQSAESRYILQAGTVIPAALRTAINSDAPGRIVAQVTAPVYDSLNGEYLLIPQGSRLLGVYESKVRYGDRRVRIVWNRLILPDGASLDLASMAGVDASGASGLSARVDDHWDRVALASVFSGALSTAANSAKDKNSSAWAQSVGDAAAQEAARAGGRIVDRQLDVRPTLSVRAGAKVRVLVERDLVLREYQP